MKTLLVVASLLFSTSAFASITSKTFYKKVKAGSEQALLANAEVAIARINNMKDKTLLRNMGFESCSTRARDITVKRLFVDKYYQVNDGLTPVYVGKISVTNSRCHESNR